MSERLSTKNKIKIVLLSIVSILMMGASLGLLLNLMLKSNPEALAMNKEFSTSSTTSYNQTTYTEEDKAEKEISEKKEIQEYEPGKYQVGKDLPAGTYKLEAAYGNPGFYRISKTASDNYLDISENDVFPTFTYVFVSEGQFLSLVDAKAVRSEEAVAYSPKDGKYISGKYLVGKDIPEGDYIVYPERDFGYIEISPAAVRDVPNLILSKYIDSPYTINVSEGEFLKLSSAYIEIQ